MNPKVFISHATEDKERFVIGFAQKLRNKGVDAWLDQWEMLPGDSLVDKIFEEGIKNSKAIIVVLSSNSVGKKWVREELDAAMVKRVNKGSLLIPVVLDDCVIPECLHSTIWQNISDLSNYDGAFNRILNAIFDHRTTPPLGEIPDFAKAEISLLPGYTKTDSIILKIACELGLRKDSLLSVSTEEVLEEASLLAMSEEVAFDSLEVLDHNGLIKLKRVLGGPPPYLEVTTLGMERFADSYVPGYQAMNTQVVACIVNNNMRSVVEIATTLGILVPIVKHIFRLLEMNGYAKISREFGASPRIYNVSPTLKRLLA